MNDRFKFRIWDKKIKKIRSVWGLTPFGPVACDSVKMGGTHRIPLGDCIIMPCTGLKDKNGKLIYEGDILRCVAMGNLGELDDAEYFYNIIFDNSNACFKARGIKLINQGKANYDLVNRSFEELEYFTDGIFEVIGNQFENHELLEEQCANQLNKG